MTNAANPSASASGPTRTRPARTASCSVQVNLFYLMSVLQFSDDALKLVPSLGRHGSAARQRGTLTPLRRASTRQKPCWGLCSRLPTLGRSLFCVTLARLGHRPTICNDFLTTAICRIPSLERLLQESTTHLMVSEVENEMT